MERNVKFSENAVRKFDRYCDKVEGSVKGFFAVPFQMGRGQVKTRYILIEAQEFKKLAHNDETKHLFRERKGALVWKGLDACAPSNNISLKALPSIAYKDFPHGIKQFEAPEAKTLSDAQEMIVKAWIENEVFTSEAWAWVGRKHLKARYNTDIKSEGGIQIEVKGKDSDLCISYNEVK